MCCEDPIAVEQFYTKHFGFKRARVYAHGPHQTVMLKRDDVRLEIFPATKEAPAPPAGGAGPEFSSWRHIAFVVDDIEAKLAEMGDEAKVTLKQLNLGQRYNIPGLRTCFIADPAGNIIELLQGYVDQDNPPSLEADLANGLKIETINT